jgi:pyruvate/2-oxoglutarate dehydrogenase complex dihydrolipoamide acyltransferase (E2) component
MQGEDVSELIKQAEAEAPEAEETLHQLLLQLRLLRQSAAPPVPAPAPTAAAPAAPAPAPVPSIPAANGRLKASPLAKKLAEERGLSVAHIPGSGEGGRVVKRDVEAFRLEEWAL